MSEEKKDNPVRISVTAGEMTFPTVPYGSFKVGSVFASSDVLPHETVEQTVERLTAIAIKAQRDIFKQQRDLYWQSYNTRSEQGGPASPFG